MAQKNETSNVSVLKYEDLKADLKDFLERVQSRSARENTKKIQEYISPMVSETSVFNRVPLDGEAVLNIYNCCDRTLAITRKFMKYVMWQEILVTIRENLQQCNHLEIRLQSLLYHIAYCPQYDLEIVDITKKLDEMEVIVTNLEQEYNTETEKEEESEENLLTQYGLHRIDERGDTGDKKEEKRRQNDEEGHQDD